MAFATIKELIKLKVMKNIMKYGPYYMVAQFRNFGHSIFLLYFHGVRVVGKSSWKDREDGKNFSKLYFLTVYRYAFCNGPRRSWRVLSN